MGGKSTNASVIVAPVEAKGAVDRECAFLGGGGNDGSRSRRRDLAASVDVNLRVAPAGVVGGLWVSRRERGSARKRGSRRRTETDVVAPHVAAARRELGGRSTDKVGAPAWREGREEGRSTPSSDEEAKEGKLTFTAVLDASHAVAGKFDSSEALCRRRASQSRVRKRVKRGEEETNLLDRPGLLSLGANEVLKRTGAEIVGVAALV